MYSPTLSTASPTHPLPRFAGDWITAWLDRNLDTGLLHIGADPTEWVLEAYAPHKLAAALTEVGPVQVQFNPELLVLLLPGAHQLVGSSFFRLHH